MACVTERRGPTRTFEGIDNLRLDCGLVLGLERLVEQAQRKRYQLRIKGLAHQVAFLGILLFQQAAQCLSRETERRRRAAHERHDRRNAHDRRHVVHDRLVLHKRVHCGVVPSAPPTPKGGNAV